MKLELCHADTCLPEFWSGHHRAHVQIAVWPGMTMKDIREAIKSELSQGAVAGSDDLAFLLSTDYVGPDREKDADRATRAAYAAVNRMRPARKCQRRFFTDIDVPTDVCAFFVFMPID